MAKTLDECAETMRNRTNEPIVIVGFDLNLTLPPEQSGWADCGAVVHTSPAVESSTHKGFRLVFRAV